MSLSNTDWKIIISEIRKQWRIDVSQVFATQYLIVGKNDLFTIILFLKRSTEQRSLI